ncbi:MAG: hypothetical protein LBL78_04260 [Prevotellaceae bacterium]|jgi:hypothetical protein|nr:hypothetical protein [Prevotellaceae bacterium]
MTDEERNRLSTFEARLRHLIYLYEEQKRENVALRQQLEEQKRASERAKADYEALDTDYTNLKTAMTISLDGGDVNKTRQRLSRLVREVDKCIALLKT